MGHSLPLFILVFPSQLTVKNVSYKCLLMMAVFEPRTADVGSDRSTNRATTTALKTIFMHGKRKLDDKTAKQSRTRYVFFFWS